MSVFDSPLFSRGGFMPQQQMPQNVNVALPDIKPRGMFGGGFGQRLGSALGNIGSILQDVDDPNGRSAEQLDLRRSENAAEAAWRQQQVQAQMLTAQRKAVPEEPSVIRTLRAAGIDPASPQGQALIRQNIAAPHYLTLGNAEIGQTVIDPSMSGGAPVAPQTATVNGKTYYNINGEWFDNAEGR